jgi:hypothetical protein
MQRGDPITLTLGAAHLDLSAAGGRGYLGRCHGASATPTDTYPRTRKIMLDTVLYLNV